MALPTVCLVRTSVRISHACMLCQELLLCMNWTGPCFQICPLKNCPRSVLAHLARDSELIKTLNDASANGDVHRCTHTVRLDTITSGSIPAVPTHKHFVPLLCPPTTTSPY